jgi:hypothetical protein
MYYKLYSAAIRSHVEIRAPYLEGCGSIEELKASNAWKYRPSVITDEDGRIVESNGLDSERTS